jgi:hypothetical protein
MSDRIRFLNRLINTGSGLSEVIGAAYRGVVLLGESSSIARLAERSEELALKVFGAKQYYLLFLQTGDDLSRQTALALTEDLVIAARTVLKGNDLTSASQTFIGWRRALTEGADETSRLATAQRLEQVARRRGLAYLDRLAVRSSSSRIGEFAAAIDLEITKLLTGPATSAERRAVELFLNAVPRTDLAAWEGLVMKMVGFSKLDLKAKRLVQPGVAWDEEAFKKAFRPEASGLKGLALETWFWRSPAWKSRERRLLQAAHQRARQLGLAREEWKPVVISEPLLTIGGAGRRGGLEIYDGVVVIARRFDPNARSVEGFLDAAIQIKAERDISAIRQVSKDTRREVELGGLTELRTRDGNIPIRLLPAPDTNDPIRLVVAPELPSASKYRDLAPGVNIVAMPTLLDAKQLDYLAYFLIRAAIR